MFQAARAPILQEHNDSLDANGPASIPPHCAPTAVHFAARPLSSAAPAPLFQHGLVDDPEQGRSARVHERNEGAEEGLPSDEGLGAVDGVQDPRPGRTQRTEVDGKEATTSARERARRAAAGWLAGW